MGGEQGDDDGFAALLRRRLRLHGAPQIVGPFDRARRRIDLADETEDALLGVRDGDLLARLDLHEHLVEPGEVDLGDHRADVVLGGEPDRFLHDGERPPPGAANLRPQVAIGALQVGAVEISATLEVDGVAADLAVERGRQAEGFELRVPHHQGVHALEQVGARFRVQERGQGVDDGPDGGHRHRGRGIGRDEAEDHADTKIFHDCFPFWCRLLWRSKQRFVMLLVEFGLKNSPSFFAK